MTAIASITAICSDPSCRRRQTVPPDRIWFVTVRHGSGSHRDAGWQCMFCLRDNVTKASHLPRGMLGQLPSREKVLLRLAAKDQLCAESAPTPAAGPSWAVGADARAMLIDGLSHIAATGGDALAIATRNGLMEPVEPASLPGSMPSGQDIGSIADLLLTEMERIDADILILSGCANGTRWQTILHPRSGAASFA